MADSIELTYPLLSFDKELKVTQTNSSYKEVQLVIMYVKVKSKGWTHALVGTTHHKATDNVGVHSLSSQLMSIGIKSKGRGLNWLNNCHKKPSLCNEKKHVCFLPIFLAAEDPLPLFVGAKLLSLHLGCACLTH